jgi:short-subunit dehydrogenase
VSNYLEGLRIKAARTGRPIHVTEIQPGYVRTAMAKGEGLFWVASVERAAAQIARAIAQRRPHAYVTRRWRLIAWLLKIVPGSWYRRL